MLPRYGIRVLCAAIVGVLWQPFTQAQPTSFLNFETAPVHPVELSPDGRTLAVCNLPDGRVELFDVSSGVPQPLGDIPVGLDPVTVRWRSTNELWVVNYISSSISVVNIAKRLVMETLQTKAGPADVVFAGVPQRAYVSCAREDVVQVFHPESHLLETNLAVLGDRPKAMAVSPDGLSVYVAIFESGNASTILAPAVTTLDVDPGSGVLEDAEGPYHGRSPPPNRGTNFQPAIEPYLDTNALPPGSLIVKKNGQGRWMDDNNGDWTDFVSGPKAARAGRVPGWDMPDRDLAVIDTATHRVTYATGLMNLCMALAVNPASGRIAVVGTDGKNEVRFEPNLRGVFLRVNVGLVAPDSLSKTIRDLNPHLDYATASIAPAERAKSLGDPRCIVWNAAGTRAYVTGMGSRNLVVIDGNGNRVQNEAVELEEGPTGLALDESRGRLYVLNRFSASVSVVDTTSLEVLTNVVFFDPTPGFIKLGRRHFHDTRRTSGLGHVSCASCHPDGRFDRLAWDLGVPRGEMTLNGAIAGRVTNAFHPMKGAMVTLTLQGIIGLEPFHWRGDRDSLLDFHVTFTDLLAADRLPTVSEMRELELFLKSVRFPPNFHRRLNNTLSDSVPLPGHAGLATNNSGQASPLPNGNAVHGLELFLRREFPPPPPHFVSPVRCASCHDCQSFSSREEVVVPLSRNHGLTFRSPSLRSVAEKVGMNLRAGESRAGFGFLHDGRADTLTRFLADGFGFDNDQDIADQIAFLLSAAGGDLYNCSGDAQHGVDDAPAGVGRQVTMNAPEMTDELAELISLTENDHPRRSLEIIARGRQDGVNRGWYLDNSSPGPWSSDRNGSSLSNEELLALAMPEFPLTFMAVVSGTARRLGIDRDDDGRFDRTETDEGSNPLDPNSPSISLPPDWVPPYPPLYLSVYSGEAVDETLDSYAQFEPRHPNRRIYFSFVDPAEAPPGASIDAERTRFQWQVPPTQTNQNWIIRLRVEDNARPAPDETTLFLQAAPFGVRIGPNFFSPYLAIDWPGGYFRSNRRYEVLGTESLDGSWKRLGFVHSAGPWLDLSHQLGGPRRFYRVVVSP